MNEVAWQYREFYDEFTVTPGWSEWELCDKGKFEEILYYISRGYKYQVRSLVVKEEQENLFEKIVYKHQKV